MPYSGGLFNQPGYVVIRMEKVLIASDVVEEAELKREEEKAKAENKLEERFSGTKS